MKLNGFWNRKAAQTAEWDAMDVEMKQAIGDFKASVHAWSDAALSRPRIATHAVAHHGLRLGMVWAMAMVLLTGGVSGSLYVHHRNVVEKQAELARRQEEQQRLVAAQRARQEEILLSNVDSDLSRQVPQALEPLAQLMNEDQTQ
jgi:hypothetical protein